MQVTGLTSLTSDDIEMHHFHSANEPKTVATFKSKVLNQIMAMGVGSQRSNSMTLQTDCDQRDERLGWMGDMSVTLATAGAGCARGVGSVAPFSVLVRCPSDTCSRI